MGNSPEVGHPWFESTRFSPMKDEQEIESLISVREEIVKQLIVCQDCPILERFLKELDEEITARAQLMRLAR